VDLGIPYQEEALANSLRCLDSIRGDDYRTALTRIWVAENVGFLGKANVAINVLQRSTPHYLIPYGCVETSLVLLGQDQGEALRRLILLGLDLLPLTVGRGAELVQFQLLKLATVAGDKQGVARAWAAESLTQVKLQGAYAAFVQNWQPDLWNRLRDWLQPSRQWLGLKAGATRQEEIDWNAERAVDMFTALLFLKEAEARVRRKENYPSHWIGFVRGGISSPGFNTRPAGLSAEMAQLALLEKRPEVALALVEKAWKLLGGWAPQMSGIYPIERDLALVMSAVPGADSQRQEAKNRIAKRTEILRKHLDSFEQMIQLPLLAESFHALGDKEQAMAAWKTAAELCAQNQNPESQSIGLTRIWMSYARANTWPDKETEALLAKIEKKLPEEYAKVNF